MAASKQDEQLQLQLVRQKLLQDVEQTNAAIRLLARVDTRFVNDDEEEAELNLPPPSPEDREDESAPTIEERLDQIISMQQTMMTRMDKMEEEINYIGYDAYRRRQRRDARRQTPAPTPASEAKQQPPPPPPMDLAADTVAAVEEEEDEWDSGQVVVKDGVTYVCGKPLNTY